jgi:hypothetical protein
MKTVTEVRLNGVIQVMQNPACVVGFLKEKRQATRVSPAYFRASSADYHYFVQAFAEQRHVEIVLPPKGVNLEDRVDPYYEQLHRQNGIAVILKSRENARVAVCFPYQGDHVELLKPMCTCVRYFCRRSRAGMPVWPWPPAGPPRYDGAG